MVSYISNVCGSISGGAEEESGKPLEQTVGLDRGVLGRKWLCSVRISALKWFSQAGRDSFGHSCPVERTLCITGLGLHVPCYALTLTFGHGPLGDIVSPTAGHLSSG